MSQIEGRVTERYPNGEPKRIVFSADNHYGDLRKFFKAVSEKNVEVVQTVTQPMSSPFPDEFEVEIKEGGKSMDELRRAWSLEFLGDIKRMVRGIPLESKINVKIEAIYLLLTLNEFEFEQREAEIAKLLRD